MAVLKVRNLFYHAWLGLGLVAGIASAGELGQKIGEFTPHPWKLAQAKSSAGPYSASEAKSSQAVARLATGFNANDLIPYGWTIINAYKGIATLEGDLATFASIQELPGVLEINLARKVSGTMEAARKLSRVDDILKWGPRPSSSGVNGKGVLVGMIDFGFETHHPSFLDSAGKTRFLAIWDPNLPNIKNSPYGRGQLKVGTNLDTDPAFGEKEGDEHGTNVASVAVGSDRSNAYYGVAPEASLIGVNLSTKNDSADLETNIMNGINWIFHVADSLKMPSVINLSLGNSHMGPHDGTSLFDRFIDTVTGPGHLVVGAFGNDGDKKLHASFTLATSGDTTGTFCPMPAAIDVWGEVGKPFRFQVLIMDSVSHSYMASTTYLSTATGTGRPMGDSITWTNPTTKKSQGIILIVVIQKANAGNGKPHAEIQMFPAIKDSSPNPQVPMMGVRFLGTGTLQAWNGTSKPFSSQGITRFIDGDYKMTLSEIGGTSKSIISVGSYTSTSVFTDYTGKIQDSVVNQKVGELSTWSSLGPAADGRIKPDICAPGRMIIAAFSSAMVNPYPWQMGRIVLWPDQTNKLGRFFAAEGTSLSAPMVTGVLALMLEKSPKLTPTTAKDILSKTAYKDAFTGSLTVPDASWGAGKLDATAAVVLASGGTVKVRPPESLGNSLRAIYNGGFLHIEGLMLPEDVKASIYDWKGRRLGSLTKTVGNRFNLDLQPLGPGIYLALLQAPGFQHSLPFFYPY
jgi:minor extracellular serine protease Vpr